MMNSSNLLIQESNDNPSHVAFADEAYYTDGQYRGLGLVSLRYGDYPSVTSKLKSILDESNIKEFKWNKLKSARERYAALKLIRYAIEIVHTGILRFDLLTWDIMDSRHTIERRDEICNLHRMYYHLCRNVFRQRWRNGATWMLCPDKNLSMQWDKVDKFLEKKSHTINPTPSLFEPYRKVDVVQNYQVKIISPVNSEDEPLVQLVDLFTGLAVYSRLNYRKFSDWESTNDEQLSLGFDESPSPEPKLSSGDKERFIVLQELNQQCKLKKLNVSLHTEQGLKTRNPKDRINFWWYTPQSTLDKAPVSVSKKKVH
jgi:hypothetical protein